MPDVENDDGFVGDGVVDAVGIAGRRQDADVGLACPDAEPGIVTQAFHAPAQVIADAIGCCSARLGLEVVPNGGQDRPQTLLRK